MWLHRRSEEPAPTEVVCYWKKPVLSQVGTADKFIKAENIGRKLKKPNVILPDTTGFFEEVFEAINSENNIYPLTSHHVY